MCGSEKGPFYNATLEGTKMRVCNNCRGYAKEAWLIKDTLPQEPKKRLLHSQQVREQERKEEQERGEIIMVIVEDYGGRIKQAREKQGVKQEDLAKRLAVKESELHAWESQHRKPRMEMARKLEKALGITLVEQHEEKRQQSSRKSSGPLTIGDLLKR